MFSQLREFRRALRLSVCFCCKLDATLTELRFFFVASPRLAARAGLAIRSNPWAECWNPVGIQLPARLFFMRVDRAIGKAITPTTPLNQHIVIRNVTATNCSTAGIIRGLPEAPITDLLLTNVHISAQSGLVLYHATGVSFLNSSIHVDKGDNVTAFNAQVEGLDVKK